MLQTILKLKRTKLLFVNVAFYIFKYMVDPLDPPCIIKVPYLCIEAVKQLLIDRVLG